MINFTYRALTDEEVRGLGWDCQVWIMERGQHVGPFVVQSGLGEDSRSEEHIVLGSRGNVFEQYALSGNLYLRRETHDGPFHPIESAATCPVCQDDVVLHEWVTFESGDIVECDRQDGSTLSLA